MAQNKTKPTGANVKDYLAAQYELWFDDTAPPDMDDREWRTALGVQLKQHSFFRNLLTVTRRGLMTQEALAHELVQNIRPLREGAPELQHLVAMSLLSLVAHARGPGGLLPLVSSSRNRNSIWRGA